MRNISYFFYFVFLAVLSNYCVTKISFDHVASKYEYIADDIATLFYPAKNPKRIMVGFSWWPRNYSMWSWFWNAQELWEDTCYLFISDLRWPRYWYLNKNDDNFESRLQQIILYFMNQSALKPHNLFFIGASMGGYGALYHGIRMGVGGVIAFNPQVDRESAAKREWHDEIANSGPWFKPLEIVVDQSHYVPPIALYVSSYIKDFAAAHSFVNAIMKKNGFFMYTKIDKNYHSGAEMFDFTKQLIERDIAVLESRC